MLIRFYIKSSTIILLLLSQIIFSACSVQANDIENINVRPCLFTNDDLSISQIISSSSIFFAGDYKNVYNAGVAAKYVDGYILQPNGEFSFNKVVGKRTKERGFKLGYDNYGNLVFGGGVCRTSTVLFQVSKKAGFKILERHPHPIPINYTPAGTDASVQWGIMDFRFQNNSNNKIIIHSGLRKEKVGSTLWAELWKKKSLRKVEVVISKKKLESFITEKNNTVCLTALIKDDISFVSLEQLSDLYHFSYITGDKKDGLFNVRILLNNQDISFKEANKNVLVNGINSELSASPFYMSNCNNQFWIPLRDFIKLTGDKIQWCEGTSPFIILECH